MPGQRKMNIPKIEPGITIKQEPMTSPEASTSNRGNDSKGSTNSLRLGSPRLPSFKGPRDLTLSSLSPAQKPARVKKTFLPNIPVRREKGERVVESKSEKSFKKSPNKFRNEHGRGRGRGRGKEFIQTKGSLFGDGIAASPFIKRSMNYGGHESSRAGEIQRPVFNPTAAYTIDKEMEERRLQEFLRDDFIDDPDEEDLNNSPIHLPMASHEDNKPVKSELESEIKKLKINTSAISSDVMGLDVKVKQEPGCEIDDSNYGAAAVQPPSVGKISNKDVPLRPTVAEQLLSCRENDFIRFQLPTCLPGYPLESMDRPGSEPGKSSTNSKGAKGKSNPLTLKDLPEGQIGNIKIYESGKVELWLGDHFLLISPGIPCKFVEKVVKIDKEKDDDGETNMTELGYIKEHVVVNPDFEAMCKDMKKL